MTNSTKCLAFSPAVVLHSWAPGPVTLLLVTFCCCGKNILSKSNLWKSLVSPLFQRVSPQWEGRHQSSYKRLGDHVFNPIGSGVRLNTLQVCSRWHTSFSKALPLKVPQPPQTGPPTEGQVVTCVSLRGMLLKTPWPGSAARPRATTLHRSSPFSPVHRCSFASTHADSS